MIGKAFGLIQTENGGEFDLCGDYFLRSFPAFGGPAFGIEELPKHLDGLKIIGIGENEVGEEAHVIIDDTCLPDVEQVRKFFSK